MTAIVSRFALIGRSYPSDAYQDLYRALLVSRAERRTRLASRNRETFEGPVFRGSGETVAAPAKLSA